MFGLLPMAEKIRYVASLARTRRSNQKFILANPGFKLPPAALAYDAYSAPDWAFYKESGVETATFIASLVKKYVSRTKPIRILEWGCGPARVVRHVSSAVGGQVEVFGSDYNSATVAWCKDNIPEVHFAPNLLNPPLPFEAENFDFIYAISVFTHLSEPVCNAWISELFRIARPQAVLMLTTNGDSMEKLMLPDELKVYRETGVFIRDGVEEGKRCFLTAYSPHHARENMFRKFELLEHVPAAFPYTAQDYWLLKRTAD
jgi:SAM-dependent methyltransferase